MGARRCGVCAPADPAPCPQVSRHLLEGGQDRWEGGRWWKERRRVASHAP